MIVMAADLEAGGIDFFYEVGKVGGCPAENEEGGFGIVLREEVEDPAGVLLDSGGVLVPAVVADEALEGGDLVVIFDVDGEIVADHGFYSPLVR